MQVPLPGSQARSPIHTIPFEVLPVLEVELVRNGLGMEIAPQTRGQMAKSQLERGTGRGLFSRQAPSVCTAAGAENSPTFRAFPGGRDSPHLGDFTQKIVCDPQGKL